MLKKRNIFKILLLPTVIFALGLGVFRTYALANFIEPDTGLYYGTTVVKILFLILTAILIGFVFVCGFVTKKQKSPDSLDSQGTFTVFTSALCAAVYLLVFVYGIYVLVSGFNSSQQVIGGVFAPNQSFLRRLVNAAPEVTSNGILFLIQVLLCVPAALNHISVCTKNVRKKDKHYALLCLCETLFFAFRIVEVFMDTKSQINTSQRSLEILMLCSVMLFFMYESQFLVNAEGGTSISKYYMSALGVISFAFVAVLPYLAVSAFGNYAPKFALVYVLECCVALFAAARIFSLNDSSEQGE